MLSRIFTLIAAVAVLVGCTKKEMQQGSSGMEPTIKQGEVFTVDFAAYSKTEPIRWDVVLLKSPFSDGGYWTSRVVGLPGETIDIRNGKVVIDGKEETLPTHLSIGGYNLPKVDLYPHIAGPSTFPFKIPEGSYFILGDNVSNVADSRYFGGLQRANIVGKVLGK